MPTYIFIGRRPDGASVTMDINDLHTEADASAYAEALLAQHWSVATLEVWRDDLLLVARAREDQTSPPPG